MTHRIVIPAQAGIHFDVQPFNRSTMDSGSLALPRVQNDEPPVIGR
jgi:hypothetical protein